MPEADEVPDVRIMQDVYGKPLTVGTLDNRNFQPYLNEHLREAQEKTLSFLKDHPSVNKCKTKLTVEIEFTSTVNPYVEAPDKAPIKVTYKAKLVTPARPARETAAYAADREQGDLGLDGDADGVVDINTAKTGT